VAPGAADRCGRRRALTALETLFTQEGRWEECVEVLERRVAALASVGDKVDVLMQVASIWSEKIGDGGSAAEAYERVLKMDPSHGAASAALEEVYRQRKVWPELVELLLARVEYTGETEEKINSSVRLPAYMRSTSVTGTLPRHAAGRVPGGLLKQHRSQGAGTVGQCHQQVADLLSEYTQAAQGMEDAKQAADLWSRSRVVRLGPAPY